MSRLVHFYADDKLLEYLNKIPKMEKSKFIREAINEKIVNSNPEDKLNQSKKLIEEAEILKKQAKKQREEIQKQKAKFENLSEAEESFLIDTKRKLNKNPQFFEGRYRSYNNEFKQITKKEFEDLINNIKLKEVKEWEIKQ